MSTSAGARTRHTEARGAGARSLDEGATGTALVPVALWLLGLALAFHPTFRSGFGEIQGYPGNDPVLIAYFLEHAYGWLAGSPGHADFWTPPFFFPERGVATYSDVLIGAVPLYAPWRLLGLTPLTAYQLWVLSVWSVNYAAAAWMLRRSFGVGRAPAAVGAFLFAFGSARMATMNHQQLLVGFYQVLALMALIEVFGRSEARAERTAPELRKEASGGDEMRAERLWIAVFFLALLGQLYTAVYPLFFFVLGVLAAFLAALLRAPWRAALFAALRRNAAILAIAGSAAALLAWPLARRYLGTSAQVGWYPYDPARLPGVLSWFLMGPGNLAYGWADRLPGVREWSRPLHHNGVGLVTFALAAVGIVRARSRTAVVLLAIATAAVFVSTLYLPGGFSLWSITRLVVPGGGAIRAVARAGSVLIVPASIGVALFLQQQSGRWPASLLVALTAVCIAEQLHVSHGIDKRQFEWRVARTAARVPRECRSFFLTTTGTTRDADVHDEAMWIALASGVPTVNGRSGTAPPGWKLHRAHASNAAESGDVRRRLAAWVARSRLSPDDVCVVEIDRRSEWQDWEREKARAKGGSGSRAPAPL